MQRVPQGSGPVRLVRFYGLGYPLPCFPLSHAAASRSDEIHSDHCAPNRSLSNHRAFVAMVLGLTVILGLFGISGCAGGFEGAKPLAAVAPTVTQPANQTVMVGQTATFSVTASGTGPLSYQWFKNGVAISGATSSTYTTPATVSGDTGSGFTGRRSNFS